jgi:uncharacterized membrane protein
MKKWRCTVCGYIHTGDEPPEICPVCGADRSKFVEVTDAADNNSSNNPQTKATAAPASSTTASAPGKNYAGKDARAKEIPVKRSRLDTANDLMSKHHLHPISVHVPNGVVPAVILFVILGILFTSSSLFQAAFYNLIFVVLALPVVLYSGFNEWQRKYRSARTRIFIAKIISAAVVTVFVVIVVAWYLFNPELIRNPSSMPALLFVLHLVLLLATAIAGYLGGKLVFKD